MIMGSAVSWSWVCYISALLVAVSWTPTTRARQDIPAQLYKLYEQQASVTPPSFVPDPLPDAIVKRLRGIKFTDLSTALQHALLWDVGLVASGDTDRKRFVQIQVPCGSTMDDIFLARDTIAQTAKCSLVTCNAKIQHFARSNCTLEEQLTKCAIAASEPVEATSSNPIWSEDGEIEELNPSFQVFVKKQGDVTLYTIQQKPKLRLTDEVTSCPTKPAFIVPCRRLSSANEDDAWCTPDAGVLVDLWITQERDAKMAPTVAPTKEPNESEQDHQDDTISSLSMVLMGVSGVLLVVCLILVGCLCRIRRGRAAHAGSTASSNSEGYHHRLITPGAFPVTDTNTTPTPGRPSLNPHHPRPSTTSSDLEKQNQAVCDNSIELASFCSDPELQMKRITYSSLHFTALLAQGAMGDVWRGEYNGQAVAIKRILKEKHGDTVSLERFASEIRLASSLEHANIVQFIGLSWRSLATDLCMVSDFMPKGDLAHFLLSKESRNLSWTNTKMSLALDIANALVYLHSLMPVIIHRDLKSLNVLLSENLEAKLSDFGLSRERSFEETMTSGVGTMLWTAPEVLRGDRYTEKADIYSYGVVLSELDTCLPPYSLNDEVARAKQKNAQLLPLIRNGRITPRFRANAPESLLEVARACLDYEPGKRPNAMQIVYLLQSRVMPSLVETQDAA